MKKLARIYTLVLTFALALLSLVGCAERNRTDQNADADFSHEGSSDGAGSLPTLEKLMQAKGAAFDKKTALSVRGSKVKDSEAVVRDWVKALSK